VRLSAHYVMTAPDATPEAATDAVRTAMARGERLVGLRLPGQPPDVVRDVAASLVAEVRSHGATLVLYRDIEGALALGIAVHLDPDQLRAVKERPLPWSLTVGASCRDAEELELASAIGCDFATLSPVLPSPDHANAEPLGWPRFARLAEAASLPVYAEGGLGPDDMAEARMHAAQGVAAVFNAA